MATRREREKRQLRYNSAKDRAERHEKAFEPTALSLPEGCNVIWKFKRAGTHRIDFLPYEVKRGEGDPGGNPFCDAGMLHYERTYYVHRVPTAENSFGSPYCCLQRTFGERCPVCEALALARRRGTMSQDSIDELDCKERQLFNVIDLDEPEKGVQILEFNWFQLGNQLDKKAKAKAKYEGFYHLTGGKTVEITTEEGSFGGRANYKPVNFEFESRDDYDESILDKVHDLDAIPKRVPYDELKAVFEQSPDGEGDDPKDLRGKVERQAVKGGGEDDRPTAARGSAASAGRSMGTALAKSPSKGGGSAAKGKGLKVGDYVEYDGQECKVLKVSGDGTSLTLEDEDGDERRGVDPDEVSKVPVADDKEGEVRATAKDRGKKQDDDEDPDDDNDDDEDMEDDDEDPDDDEPEPPKRKAAKAPAAGKAVKGGRRK